MNAVSYYFSDAIVLMLYRAQIVGPEDAPELYAIVANLASGRACPCRGWPSSRTRLPTPSPPAATPSTRW